MRTDAAQSVRQVAVIVAVVAMVALAGCSSGGSTTTAPGTDTTSEPDTTTEPNATPSVDVEPANVSESHAAALSAAGSFTSRVDITQEVVQDGNTTAISVDRRTAIDLEAGTGLRFQSSTGLLGPNTTINTTSYTAGDTTYMRVTSPLQDEPRLLNASEPYSPNSNVQPVNASQARGEAYIGQNVTWSSNGTTTVDGTTVARFTASGAENLPDIAASMSSSNLTVERLDAEMLVDSDGVVRRLTLDVSGTQANGNSVSSSIEYTVTEIGSTNVSEPGWVADA